MRVVGLMSGTSLDGIDAALIDVRSCGDGYGLKFLRGRTDPFEPAMRARLRAALPPNRPAPAAIAALDAELGRMLGALACALLGDERADLVASHGLTLYHDGAAHLTAQIGDPFAIRAVTGTTVISDFRRADCAVGGEGAPLVPYVDALVLGSADEDRVAINLGGIANLTVLPRGGSPAAARAWDCGPGNILIDGFVRSRTNGAESFDRDGGRASVGAVDRAALATLLSDDYFERVPPKSTGREWFGDAYLTRRESALQPLTLDNGCATLVALTVETIARDVERAAPAGARLILSGGGVHNRSLVAALGERLPAHPIERSDAFGIDADLKEASAFAVLGFVTLRERPANLPRATGARTAALLGTIAPVDLRALLAKMDAESAPKEAR